jgi:signal transduction histidine kinase
MRSTDWSFPQDWLAISLRWLTLLVLTVSLSFGNGLSTAILLMLVAAALWNMTLTVMSFLRERMPFHSTLVIAGDLILAALLFILGDGLQSPLKWAGILPVLSAAVYFNPAGALLVALANILILSLLASLTTLSGAGLQPVLVFAVSLLLASLLFGGSVAYLVRRMKAAVTQKQRFFFQARRDAEKAASDRRQTIYQLISTLSSSLNYQRVLDTALDLSARGLNGAKDQDDHLVSAVLLYTNNDAGGAELRIGSARRFTMADLRIVLPGTEGLIGRAIDEGESRLSKSPIKDPELSRIVALRACQAAYCIPLRAGLDTCGVLLFAHPDLEYFSPDRREILDIIGNQATIAIQNARLYRELLQEKERMMEIHEEARKKLARDLHDGPTQSVAALAMRVNFARRLMERDATAAADELYKTEELARRTTKEIRHMLFTLRPLVLESHGLIAALESMAEKMQETYNQNVSVDADPSLIAEMEAVKQGVVFYIAEEAVNNARKHAKAAHIWVRLKPAGEELALLEVRDDGVGFSAESVEANYDGRGSLGMINMRERTELLNGVLTINSTEGKGTCISLIIPLTASAADRIRRGA